MTASGQGSQERRSELARSPAWFGHIARRVYSHRRRGLVTSPALFTAVRLLPVALAAAVVLVPLVGTGVLTGLAWAAGAGVAVLRVVTRDDVVVALFVAGGAWWAWTNGYGR
jgi:hypothetical protein